MAFCLIPKQVDNFLSKLTDGTINPEKLSGMTSEERHSFLSDIVGEENATGVNSLFESKLLLKNQQQGLVTWAKKVSGISEPARRDIISKINRLENAISPADETGFLKDLVDTRIGIGVTHEEATNILEATKSIEEAKSKADPKTFEFKSEQDRLDYGMKSAMFKHYMEDLNKQPFKASDLLNIGKDIEYVSGALKSSVASLDNSFFGRQGIKILYSNPKLWLKDFAKSWSDIGKQLVAKGKWWKSGDDAAMMAIEADVMSRPNALNGKYKAGKFDLGLEAEEAFPTSAPEVIPLFGRLFKTSEVAYNGAALRMRADYADKIINAAEKFGVNTTGKEAENLGHLVNSMTGRGTVNLTPGQGKFVNAVAFSVRFIKSNIDTLISPLKYAEKKIGLGGGFASKGEEFALRESAKNMVKIVGTTAAILGTADLLWPGSVECDSRSSNFGKIKIGGFTFDITGGMGSLVTLASRMIPTEHDGVWGFWTKNRKGEYIKLSTGEYGKQTAWDVFNDFWAGKLSPLAGIARDVWQGENFNGQKPTPYNETVQGTTPIIIQNYSQFKDSNKADFLASMILDGLGFSVYSPNKSSNTKMQDILGEKRTGILGVLGAPSKQSDSFQPLIQKMIKENASLSLPTSDTTIKPKGVSRKMTPQELEKYQEIYNKNIKDDLQRNRSYILGLTGDNFNNKLDKIKTETTDKSKIELLRGMIK